jgi:AcrR family transcriptional regulator
MTKLPSQLGSKRSRSTLTLSRITDFAFEIIDREGSAALSARRLARELNCEAMSLYHHFPNMDTLLDQVVDRLLATCQLPPPIAPFYRQQLIDNAYAFLDLATKHPRVFVLATSRRWVTPSAYTLMKTSVQLFRYAGASAQESMRCARILGAYLGGAGAALAGWKLDNTALSTEQAEALDAAAPNIRPQSTIQNVNVDLMQGVTLMVDALLATIPSSA